MRDQAKPPITPETKVSELLQAYPELEEVLFKLSPAFAKLRNPALRKTVARVATLRQAAKVGGLSVADMINTLRSEAGISEQILDETGSDHSPGTCASWVQSVDIKHTLDARPLLESGQHPLSSVLPVLSGLGDGEIFQLLVPFVPVPLIDIVKTRGFEVCWAEESPGLVKVYIRPSQTRGDGSAG